MNKKINLIFIFILLSLPALASPPLAPNPTAADKPAPQGAPAPEAANVSGRTASMNFEDEIVEGINKNPFDSLTRLGKNDDKDQKRLYKKKQSFRYEIKLNVREMGLLQ